MPKAIRAEQMPNTMPSTGLGPPPPYSLEKKLPVVGSSVETGAVTVPVWIVSTIRSTNAVDPSNPNSL